MGFFGVGENKELQTLDTEIQESENTEVGQVALDIVETDTEMVIVAPIAGIELDDIDVSLNNGVLTITGERQKPVDLYHDGMTLRANECFWGKFVRNVILPDNLDLDEIKASLESSILMITIKKLKFNSQNIKIDRVEG